MGLFIFLSSSVQKLELKNSIFSGLPKKVVLFGSNFGTELEAKIKSPILKSA
jgi:hypothetical protein